MPKPDLPLNPVVRDMGEASSIYVNQLVYDLKRAGEDVTTLSLGEAYFDIPLFNFNSLNVPGSYHYSESQGLLELRMRLARYYAERYQVQVDGRSQILISAGSKAIIYLAMLAVIAPGDEVLIHEPAWLSYPEQVRLIGGQPCFIPFYCPVTEFAKHFTSRTRVLILCNPNNPTGRVYSERELARVYEDCRSCGIYLLVDEAYSEFVLDGTFRSIARIVPDLDGIIVVNSISKNLGISGWRIGYAIANHEFIGHMLKLNQHIITCAPTILLMYCARYFDELLAQTLPQVRQVVEKRQRIAKMLQNSRLKFIEGTATFYFFVSIGDFPGSSEDFAMKLLVDNKIALVPGSAYGQSTSRFVRLSIGTESDERIAAALPHIFALTKANSFDGADLAKKITAVRRLGGA